MAEGLSAAAANAALANVIDSYTWIKLHTGAPGAAGTSNAATNTTRKQVTWSSPSAGAMSNTDVPLWSSVPAAEDYTHWSAWDASTAGNFGFSGTMTANAVATGDDFDIAAGDLDVTLTVAS